MTLYVRLSSPGGAPDTVPSALAAPTVTASATQLVASWSTPPSDGGSPVTSYDLRHSVQAAETWTTVTGVTAPRTISTLVNGTTYEVQVRAVNAVGNGAWSPSGTGTPAASVFGFRAISSSSANAGTAVPVPTGAVAGDTLVFVASRDFDIGGSVVAPSGATAVGTPTDQAGGFASYLVWRILSWDGTTATYDFGQSAWAGERAIVAMQGAATAVTAGTYTVGAGTTLGWTGMTMSTGDLGIAIGGTYDGADSPVTGFDTAWTQRRAQVTSPAEWAGFTLWTDLIASGGTITPTPGGTVTTGNWSTLLLRVAP